MNLTVQIIAAVCVLGGGLLSLAAAIGLFRFPDLLSRMHSASKPQILGLALVLIAVVAMEPNWATVTTAIVIMGFQMLTAPVATHMIGRAGYRTKHLRRSMLFRDELAEAIVRADVRAAAENAVENAAEKSAANEGDHPAQPPTRAAETAAPPRTHP